MRIIQHREHRVHRVSLISSDYRERVGQEEPSALHRESKGNSVLAAQNEADSVKQRLVVSG